MWELESAEQNADAPKNEEDTILCPSCLTENKADADYCCKCNAPIGRYSTIDPVQSAVAEGRVITDGIQEPKKPIVVVGMMVIWGVPFLVTISFGIYSILNFRIGAFLIFAGISAVLGIPLVKSLRNYKSYKVSKSKHREKDE